MKIALITTLKSLQENKRIEEEVKKMDHEFELIDLQAFSFSIINNKLIIKGLEKIDADILIIRGIFNSIKSISIVINNIKKQGVKVFDNNLLTHKYSINKIADMIKLAVNNIPTPNSIYAREFEDFPMMAEKIGYPLIVKSTRMGKGVGVYKMNSKKELLKFIRDSLQEEKSGKSYLMQEFIPYEYDLRCLIIGDKVFTMRRIPGEGEFRANFSLGGSVELFDLDNEGQELAKKALSAIDMSVGGVDILITKDDKRYILEVNHTAGMIGMEEATGENITKLFVEHAINNAN